MASKFLLNLVAIASCVGMLVNLGRGLVNVGCFRANWMTLLASNRTTCIKVLWPILCWRLRFTKAMRVRCGAVTLVRRALK